MTKEQIGSLLEQRDNLYELDENHPKIDQIRDEILLEFRKNFNCYEIEYILETLTKFGDAPNLVYDDNGMWAISGEGYNEAVIGDERIEGAITTFVEESDWFDTIRKALWWYLIKEI